MNLYLIRHGIAVEPYSLGYAGDSQRPLTDKGQSKMVSITRGLKNLGVSFDLILSSPYLRAWQTANILLEGLELKKEQLALSENLTPASFPDEIIQELSEKYLNLENLALVGHEPNLSALISRLITGGNESIFLSMKKGGVCHLNTEDLSRGQRASLEWLLMPKHLVALGERA